MAKILTSLLVTVAAVHAATTVTYCHQDNCLRQLKNGNVQGWCASYLGTRYPIIHPVPTTSTVTATRTVFVVHSPDPSKPPDYITRKAAPYIVPNKRDYIPGEKAPAAVEEEIIEARQALPPFASSCTGSPDRLSSACTCLIGYTAEKSTIYWTKTQTTSTFTTHVCTATALNQLRPSYQGDWLDRYQVSQDIGFSTLNIQECCNICYHTWNCTGYYMREQDEVYDCFIKRLISSSNPQPNDRSCEAGLLNLYDPLPGNTFGGPFELGLCSYLTYSDE